MSLYDNLRRGKVIAGVIAIIISIIDIFNKEKFVENNFKLSLFLSILLVISFFIYSIVSFISIMVSIAGRKIVEDELTKEYEGRAAQFTLLVMIMLGFIIMFIAMFNRGKLTFDVNLITILLISIFVINDASYLYLEKKDS